MAFYLSKLLPLLVYPLGLSCVLLGAALIVQRNPRWQTRLVGVTLAILWLGGNRIVTMTIVRSLEWRYAPPPGRTAPLPTGDAIVLLGGATRELGYPRPTHEVNEAGDRILYAAWLYNHGAAPRILISGGTAPWVSPQGGPPEAEAMAELLGMMGVPREALILETESRNTYENAVGSFELLAEHDVKTVILVTSALHMPRAYALFQHPDFTVIPAPTDYMISQAEWDHYTQPSLAIQVMNLIPSSRDLALTSQAMKEYIGMIVYRMRGWM